MSEAAIFELIEGPLALIAFLVDMVGVAIIIFGFVVGIIDYVRTVLLGGSMPERYRRFQEVRCRVGVHLILALEFMIVSDIITSVVSRTLDNLIYLGAIVVIRTVLAYFLDRDMAALDLRIRI